MKLARCVFAALLVQCAAVKVDLDSRSLLTQRRSQDACGLFTSDAKAKIKQLANWNKKSAIPCPGYGAKDNQCYFWARTSKGDIACDAVCKAAGLRCEDAYSDSSSKKCDSPGSKRDCLIANNDNLCLCEAAPAAPVDCVWTDWTDWSACPVSCGGGTITRSRSETVAAANGGAACSGENLEEVTCSSNDCPLDCEWTDWSAWSDCSATCGSGATTRSRRVEQEKVGAGAACLDSNGNEVATGSETSVANPCNTFDCPVDCEWGDWGDWSGCSVTCGGGTQTSSRVVQVITQGGASCATEAGDIKDSGSETKAEECSTGACPTTTASTTAATTTVAISSSSECEAGGPNFDPADCTASGILRCNGCLALNENGGVDEGYWVAWPNKRLYGKNAGIGYGGPATGGVTVETCEQACKGDADCYGWFLYGYPTPACKWLQSRSMMKPTEEALCGPDSFTTTGCSGNIGQDYTTRIKKSYIMHTSR